MQRSGVAFASLLAAALITLVGIPTTTAQTPPDAGDVTKADTEPTKTDAAFDDFVAKANSAYSSGDYEAAIAHFEAAYEIDPQPNIVYNIARVEEKLGRLEAAVSNYEKFIVLSGASPELRKDALERQKLLQEVLLSRTKSDADAITDAAPSSKDDPTTKTQSPAVGEPVADVDIEADSAKKKSVALPASLIVIGGFGLGAAGLIGPQVQTAHTSFEDTSNTNAARLSARDRGVRLSATADSLAAVGAITVVVGAVVLIKRMRHNSKIEDVSATKESASLGGVEFGCHGGALVCF